MTDASPSPSSWSPLTSAQQLLWASQQLHPDAPVYNMAFLYDIDGPIVESDFRAAFTGLIEQCDALRTVVDSVDGVPGQRVLDHVAFELPVIDLSGAADPAEAARAWAQAKCEQPLAIDRLMFDSALLKMSDRRYGWYLNQHHIVTDAWSFTVLFERMEDLYRRVRAGRDFPDEPLPAFATYQAFEQAARESNPPESANGRSPATTPALYGRRPDRVATGNERLHVELSSEESQELRDLAAQPHVRALTPDLSLFHVFATAVFAYLYRIGGQPAITIGAPAHNRVTAEFKRAAGLFTEVYPLEVVVEDDDTFDSLHAKVRRATDTFMRKAQPGHSDAHVNRGINVVLNFILGDFGPFDGAPVQAEWLHPGHVDAEHHLRLQVHDFSATGRFNLLFDCNRDVLTDAHRAAMPSHFRLVLDAMLSDWQLPLAAVDLLSELDRRKVLSAINGSAETLPTPKDVVTQFVSRATADPEALALESGSRRWTYAEIDELTSRIAGDLPTGAVVGVCLPRSAEAVLAILAVLKAGSAYVPIDPSWPESRIEYVVEDAGCALVVGVPASELKTPAVAFADLGRRPLEPTMPVAVRSDGLAYILYTSGSTGRPKGVMIEHGSLANYATWASRFYDRGRRLTFPLFSPLTFDLTVTSIFVPLISGGSIRVYPQTDALADLAVQQVFADDAVDIVKLTPSHLALLPDRDLSSSRIGQLILGGEDLTTATARRAHERFGSRVLIHNEYGPTEATVGCVLHTYQPDTDRDTSVPIGRPITNMRAYVLDAAGHPVPYGVPGELWVGGAGVARGYAGRPDLTDERFARNDVIAEPRLYSTGDLARVRPDGIIEYLGRRDDQVKIRGARVELGEVEAALASHPRVTAAAARVWQRVPGTEDVDLVYCARCGLASSYPGVSFDTNRVCNQCRSYDTYSEKARVYFKPMDELAAILKGANSESEYDCLSLLSGGKDSTYALSRLVDMGLRVLAFTLDNGYISDQAKENIQRVVDELGVDHIFASTPAMNEIFVDSLQRHANVCQGCFKTIYTLSLQTAREKGIPFIVTGLSRGQFFETRLTEDLFTELTVSADQIDANVLESRKAYHQVDDAAHRLLDVSMFSDDSIFTEVQFIDFYRYCDVGLDEMLAYLDERVPWVRPSDTGRSTNCRINDVGIYFHRRTRGFHNYALPYSWDVRLGHKTRDEALEELNDDIDVAAVQQILAEIGYPEDIADFESGRRLVSYYASPAEIPAAELRKHLSETLPDQMMPTHFVHLDAIPLTTNGKVDRAALPEPGTSRPVVDTVFLAPQTNTERTLAGIWEAVLGIDGIGIRDNFFDLGGDSIMAIQIVARAHRAGLPVTLRQLFDTPTVEYLAQEAEQAGLAAAERLVGPVDMTPIQRWFLNQHDDPGHFHQVVRVATPDDLEAEVLAECLQDLADHHDALRQTFIRTGAEWASIVAEEPRGPSVEVFDSSDQLSRENGEDKLLQGFDLSAAPLIRAGLFREPDGSSQLMLVAHHLIVDAVSWSTLLDDLAHLYRRRSRRDPAGLPAVTTSLGDWVKYLGERAPQLDPSVWSEIAAFNAEPPAHLTAGASRAVTVRVELGETSTGDLVEGAPEWQIGVDELLIAALAMTLAESSGKPMQRIFLEGHGRESDEAALDVTRTLGWFTSLYPVLLEVSDPADPGSVAREIRDAVRRVAPIAAQYGILRYLHPDPDVRRRLTLADADHVVFNYLGRTMSPGEKGDRGNFPTVAPLELSRPDDMVPSFADEVSAVVDSGQLAVTWTSATRDAKAVSTAAGRLLEHLGALMEACNAGRARRVTAGDFPLADLDEAGFDKLAAVLRAGDGTR